MAPSTSSWYRYREKFGWAFGFRVDPSTELVTSRLTRLEVRCKPLGEGNLELLSSFERFLDNPSLEIVSLTDSIVEAATLLRARKAGAADAIHIATAIESGCDAILTKDGGWKKFFPGRVIAIGVDRP